MIWGKHNENELGLISSDTKNKTHSDSGQSLLVIQ